MCDRFAHGRMVQVPEPGSDDEENVHSQSERRRFVKGVVGGAAFAGTGAATSALVESATRPAGEGGGEQEYYGIANTAGPAPRAMPQVPLEVTDEGYLQGVWPASEERERDGRTVTVAETDLGGVTYSTSWFQYCGIQDLPGIDPGTDQDDYFRSAHRPGYDWQREAKTAGDRLHVDDFDDYEEWGNDVGTDGTGKPAKATWRSKGLEPQKQIPVQVLRSTRVEELVAEAEGERRGWIEATTAEGFIAWLAKCTHFCCVPEFKGYPSSAQFGAADKAYCVCHQSVYDPYQVVKRSFTALPRPE